MLKIIIALVLLSHGIGHSMGLLQVFKVATVNPRWSGDSWLLTGLAGSAISQIVAVSLWTLAIVGFAALAAVVVGWLPEAWWAPLAIGASAASLAGLFLFPVAFPLFSTVGACAVNAAVLMAVLWFQWMPSDLAA
jgi:branched-subunit amino acid ABC-type transport system permease component